MKFYGLKCFFSVVKAVATKLTTKIMAVAAILASFGIIVLSFDDSNTILDILYSCFILWLILFAGLWIILLGITLIIGFPSLYRAKAYLTIFNEKGYCEEFVETYKRIVIYGKQKSMIHDFLILAGTYQVLERYEDAWKIYTELDKTKLSARDLAVYYCDVMSYYLNMNNTADARKILDEGQIQIISDNLLDDITRIIFYSNVATLLAQEGRYDEAMKYIEPYFVPQKRYGKGWYYSLQSNIYIHMLSGDMQAAEEAERKLIENINSIKKFEYTWQKDFFLDKIEKNKRYAEKFILFRQNMQAQNSAESEHESSSNN